MYISLMCVAWCVIQLILSSLQTLCFSFNGRLGQLDWMSDPLWTLEVLVANGCRGKDGGQGSLDFCARAGENVALVGKATTLSDVWETAVSYSSLDRGRG